MNFGVHMSTSVTDLLREIDKLQNKEFIHRLGSILGEKYEEMIDGVYGDKIVETGQSLLGYLFDLIKKDVKLGIKAINVFFRGYPDLPHTDLIAPYYDSLTTRRLWYRAIEKLDINQTIISSLVINTYFRWYSATYELFRKMLIFDCYCHGLYTGHEINVKSYLFGIKNPIKNLSSCDSKAERKKSLIKVYDSTIRHSIAHGNIIIIPNRFIVIRETDKEKNRAIEKIYENPKDFISEVNSNIEIMFGSIRFFHYILVNYLLNKYSKIFKEEIGNVFTDKVLIAIIRSIQKDVLNPVY